MANLKAVLQRPKVSATYARNAFDRSCSVNFSYQVGGLDCFYGDAFTAGSHVKINRSIFQRTSNVNTAAFPKVDTHVEFFAVPIRLLWMYWNNYKLNIQDFGSSLEGTIASSTQVFTPKTLALPFFDVHDLLKDINGGLYETGGLYTNSPYTPLTGNDRKQFQLGAQRLLSGLGYGEYPHSWQNDNDTTVFAVNPLKLLAYQKVYYDHFRNTAYESNDPSYYNIDHLTSASQINKLLVGKFCQYRYVNYRKDYMQSVYPALNYSASSPDGLSWSVPDSILYQYASSGIQSASIDPHSSNGGQVLLRTAQGNRNYLTVQQIRASFALDKLLRASAYAPKHVKDQFEARYGVKGVESGNESVRIGAFMNDIVIQEVVATNSNGSSTPGYNHRLGDIGGKGVGFSGYGDDIEFTCKEDSIILGLCYSLPRASYDATQIANWNAKLDREDFFIPEFMDMGLQPFQQFENTFMNTVAGALVPYFQGMTGIVGYKDRYSEYKIGIDRNLGNFLKGGALSDFAVHSNQDMASYSYGAANANYFKVKPTDMDSIFIQATDPADITTDKFITHIDLKVICNQNMSVHGQPRLGSM